MKEESHLPQLTTSFNKVQQPIIQTKQSCTQITMFRISQWLANDSLMSMHVKCRPTKENPPRDILLDSLPPTKLMMLQPQLARAFLRLDSHHGVELHPWVFLTDSSQCPLIILQKSLTELRVHGCLHLMYSVGS